MAYLLQSVTASPLQEGGEHNPTEEQAEEMRRGSFKRAFLNVYRSTPENGDSISSIDLFCPVLQLKQINVILNRLFIPA